MQPSLDRPSHPDMEMKTLSVCIRLLRPMAAFVAVPVTPDLLTGGAFDAERLMARAAQLGLDPHVAWHHDPDASVEIHPVLAPVPEGVEVFRVLK